MYESQDSEWVSSYKLRDYSNSGFTLSPDILKNGLQDSSHINESFVELQRMHVSGVNLFGSEPPASTQDKKAVVEPKVQKEDHLHNEVRHENLRTHIVWELVVFEIFIIVSTVALLDKMTEDQVWFAILAFFPSVLNAIGLIYSYKRNNLKFVPWMLQLIMLRKELVLMQLTNEASRFNGALEVGMVSIMVFLQAAISTFTSLPYWFRRLSPILHFFVIEFTVIFKFSNYENFSTGTIVKLVVFLVLFPLYLNSVFTALFTVVDQSIAKELNTHRSILMMFNSLQEGIVILQKSKGKDEEEAQQKKVIFANEIAKLIFGKVLKRTHFHKRSQDLVTEKIFFTYKRSEVFQNDEG